MKIEKLEYYSSSSDGYIWERHPTTDDIVDKINEIIEIINNDASLWDRRDNTNT